jgi:hypothetical protein
VWAFSVVLEAVPSARAADTLEMFDPGAVDVELYLGGEGFGAPWQEQAFSAEVFVAVGTSLASLYVGSLSETRGDLGSAAAALYAGGFRTLLDTDHVDLDLLLDVTVGGPGLSQVEVLPLLELNLDVLPERRFTGTYARLALPLGNVARDPGSDPFSLRPGGGVAAGWTRSGTSTGLGLDGRGLGDLGRNHLRATATLALGSYLTLTDRHQLLLEMDAGVALLDPSTQPAFSLGGFTLGFNTSLSSDFELISELRLRPPPTGQLPTASLVVGFILGIPDRGPTW